MSAKVSIVHKLNHEQNCCDMRHEGEYRPPPATHAMYLAFYTVSLCEGCMKKLHEELNDA